MDLYVHGIIKRGDTTYVHIFPVELSQFADLFLRLDDDEAAELNLKVGDKLVLCRKELYDVLEKGARGLMEAAKNCTIKPPRRATR